MCKVCTEAVHCVALWTRVTLQVWTCVKYVPKQSIAQRFEHVCKCKRMSSSPPHPTPPYPMWCVRGWLWVEKMMQNCACVYLWLQSVCAGDSGKWLCAHVTPMCVRGWLWVEKMMQNCACVYLWLQSVCAGDPVTFKMGTPQLNNHGVKMNPGSTQKFILQALRSCIGIVLRTKLRGGLKVKKNGKPPGGRMP